MRVLVIGGGGREHALVRALRKDPSVTAVFAAPGNAGICNDVDACHAVDLADAQAITTLAQTLTVDLVIIGPEVPLIHGAADAVRAHGIACFGPSAAAAQIEGSKAFGKNVMASAGVPTGRAVACTTLAEVDEAMQELGTGGWFVIKDDGLAAGKGVIVTQDPAAARAHADAALHARGADGRVLVEEYLTGPEVSLFAITDGTTVRPLLPAQDFKRVGDDDTGPNTGGMGAYAPLPWLPDGWVDEVRRTVLQPVVDEMARRGTPFTGLLYAGLILTADGVKVIEFNARFGDPETQAVLAMLRTPLAGLLHSAATGMLATQPPLQWHEGSAVTVVIAASGYPESPRTGDAISGLPARADDDAYVLHSGTRRTIEGGLISSGGRVLSVVGRGVDLGQARARAYALAGQIHLAGSRYRTDIAARALAGRITVPRR